MVCVWRVALKRWNRSFWNAYLLILQNSLITNSLIPVSSVSDAFQTFNECGSLLLDHIKIVKQASCKMLEFLVIATHNQSWFILLHFTSLQRGRGMRWCSWDTAVHAGRPQIRFPNRPFGFFGKLILSAALCPWGRTSLKQKWIPGVHRPESLPPSCADWNSGSLNLNET